MMILVRRGAAAETIPDSNRHVTPLVSTPHRDYLRKRRVVVIAILGWIGALSGGLMVSGSAAGKTGVPA